MSRTPAMYLSFLQHPSILCRQARRFFSAQAGAVVLVLAGVIAAPAVQAAPTHPAVIDTFVAGAFTAPPSAETLWLTPDIKARAQQALGFAPDGARLRYWRQGTRTAWVLERIGKEAPITFGVVVDGNAVAGLQVLTYRESRGFEIQSARWLAQFAGIRAAESRHGLDKPIDNISGATLSVRAGRDVARLALWLHAIATAPTP